MRFHEFGVYEINMMLAAIAVPNNVFDVSGDFARVAPGSVRPPSSVIFTARMNRDEFGCKFRACSSLNQGSQTSRVDWLVTPDPRRFRQSSAN